jgi:acyl carrier protein
MTEIRKTVRAYILEEYLPGESPGSLDDATPLITGGVLDSISTVKLVAFLEARFGVEFKAHEMSADNLDTIDDITRIVHAKLDAR